MSWDNECADCGDKISDEYERCYDCNDAYNNEEIPIAFESIDTVLPKSWVLVIRGEKVQLPHSECTLDEPKLKVWVPRWLAVKKEIDHAA